MKSAAMITLFLLPLAAFGQAPPPTAGTQNPPATEQTAPQAQETPQVAPQDTQQDAQRSTIEVKPGSPVIKQKDMWDDTGYFHPFIRMPGYILQDQKAIWTSPVHTAKKDVKLWVIFGVATAALIATDRHSVNLLPN